MTPSTSSDEALPGATTYLLIETRSPWESGDGGDFLDFARTLVAAGQPLHLHLIQNGVFWLQQGEALNALREAGMGKTLEGTSDRPGRFTLSSDDFSLDQRGIPPASAAAWGTVCSVAALVTAMARPDVKTLWHS